MRTERPGFTLVEILVVISIIAVLAAIMFPVFAQIREHSRATSCLSNVKQLGTAQMLYLQDYDEAIVPWRTATDGDPLDVQIQTCWITLLHSYFQSNSILFCPSFDATQTARAMDAAECDGNGTAGSASKGIMPAARYLSHYGIALYLKYGDCSASNPYPIQAGSGWQNANYVGLPTDQRVVFHTQTLSSVAEPARTANIGDAGTVVRADRPTVATLFGCEGRYRHNGSGCNLGFLDGHAKYVSGNPERVLQQDDQGCTYEKYFTSDR